MLRHYYFHTFHPTFKRFLSDPGGDSGTRTHDDLGREKMVWVQRKETATIGWMVDGKGLLSFLSAKDLNCLMIMLSKVTFSKMNNLVAILHKSGR